MKTKTIPGKPDFRIKFVTKDGSLVMNRPADISYYFDGRKPNTEFINFVLSADSRERGVRVVKYDITKEELTATVEWL